MFALVAAPAQGLLQGFVPSLLRRRRILPFRALARARRGAALLDRHFGDSRWDEKINPDTLDIADPCECAVGQVFEEGYVKGCKKLRINQYEQAASRGFNTLTEQRFGEFRALTHAWLIVLNERRRAREANSRAA